MKLVDRVQGDTTRSFARLLGRVGGCEGPSICAVGYTLEFSTAGRFNSQKLAKMPAHAFKCLQKFADKHRNEMAARFYNS